MANTYLSTKISFKWAVPYTASLAGMEVCHFDEWLSFWHEQALNSWNEVIFVAG